MFAFYQQHQAAQGPIGPLKWAVPGIFEEDPDISLHRCAPTPATLQYVGGTSGCEAPAIIKENPFGVPKAVLVGSSMVLTGGGTLALAFLAVRRRWRA